MATQTLSAKELAQKCGTDARTVRKFLRKHLPVDKQPGQGGRYTFTSAEATKLVQAFGKWEKGEKVATPTKAAAATKTASGKKAGKKDKPKIEVKDDEVEEIDLSDLEEGDSTVDPDADTDSDGDEEDASDDD